MTAPQTSLHYAPGSNFVGNTYAPGADGFNLADVSSIDSVNALPAGDKALVWLGSTDGNTAAFRAMVQPFIGNPKVYGFYLADEPGPNVSAANIKAESDYIHQADPGAKTFMVLENNGDPTHPSYSFNPGNTDVDLFGLDPYPIRPQFSGGANYNVIGDAVKAAEAQGIPLKDIVPVYQTFGASSGPYSSWTLPTASQEQTILSTWGQYVPHPAFDYAYAWGTQDGDTALVNDPALQSVLAAHNGGSGDPPPSSDVLTPHGTTIAATAGQSFSGNVATFTDSNTSLPVGKLSAVIHWGDGTAAKAGLVHGSNGSFSVTGSHTYAAAGSDKVTVTLKENTSGNAKATAHSTAHVSAHNAATNATADATMTATDQNGTTGNVPVIASGSSHTTVGGGAISQSVSGGTDTVSLARITSETLHLGAGTVDMTFLHPHALDVTGGSGTATIAAASGNNTFTAGTGTLDVTGGSGHDSYFFHAGDGMLKIEDFAPARDSLTIDKSLQGSLQHTPDGHGGTLLTFGSAGHGVDLAGVTSGHVSDIQFA